MPMIRLLKRGTNGDFELASFDDRDERLPPYAILSHTWTDHEVTYDELVSGTGRDKLGFDKIRFCGERAAADGLQHFWVDTCCINKPGPNDELRVAINSMFRWYQRSARCYVYLTDVSVPEEVSEAWAFPITWREAFRRSRWFTRGWTLQELLAPARVDFFSRERKWLGSKISLEKDIHRATKIPVEALRGNIAEFSINERMDWAAARATMVAEDKAYCLLGLFEVFLPLIPGEGEKYAMLRLKEEIQKRHGHALQQTSNSQSAPSQREAPWVVPFQRNPNFIGRPREMARAEAFLANDNRCERMAIAGLGGAGKTQIALEFAHRWRERYKDCAIFWIPVTSAESMLAAYLDVGKQLQIPGVENKKSEVQKLVQHELSQASAGRWLLIFDNADDIDLWMESTSSASGPSRQIDLLPTSKHGSILFTTRSRKAATKLARKNVVFVDEMTDAMSKDLLRKSLINEDLLEDEEAVEDLLRKLAHLPLAIVQAAAYINENDINLADFASLLDDTEQNVIDVLSEEFEDEGRYADIKNPIATTWLISFDQIRKRDPLAAEYLAFMSCIAAKDIPQSLLPPADSAKKAIDAIGTLTAYSFVTKHKTGQLFDLHRLVHLATRNWMRQEDILEQKTDQALQRLTEVFPDGFDHEDRGLWRMYSPHVKYILTSSSDEDASHDFIDLLGKFASCNFEDGRYKEAELAFTRVLNITKRTLGEDHLATLTRMHNLALTYRYQGRLKEAEDMQVHTLAARKRLVGNEHPHTLVTMNSLASTYADLGRWEEAKELQVQVLETRKRVLGDEHKDTLTSIGNLAFIYANLQRWEEAKELEVQVLETTKRVLGDEHPDTLTSMNNLASTYSDLQRWEEARELEVQVLETRKRVLGDEHPDTLQSISNLALTYCDLERLEEAKELNVQALETRKRVLGDEHPETLKSMNNLAHTLHSLGQNVEAISLMEECVPLRQRVLGTRHPSAGKSVEWLRIWKEEMQLE
ncbi:kinesin light chain 1 [Paraphoma chrysanthemicola]|nr:kinesin light chain 1 [Paraphoma chrysanthemicola]